jgi:hypothetical protein
MQDLAFRWSDLKESKLKKVVPVWPEARELLRMLLSEDVADRPTSWDVVLEHPFLTGAVVIEGISKIAEGLESANQKLDDVIVEQKRQAGAMEALALAQEEVAGKVDLTVHLLNEQSTQLATISDSTAATFLALKDMSEGASAVPRLVTITLKDAPAWQGAWYERTGDNLLAKLKGKVGVTQFFHLHFLCEKTLMPVLGDPGYELEIPGEKFTAFMQKIGPMLGATCALLKLVTTVGRPMAKLVGVDLPKVGSFDLGELKTMKLGESTVEEVFDGTGVDDLFDRIESIGQSESEPEPEPEPDGSEAIASDSKVQLLDFADNAIAQMESVAEWAGVPLAPPEEDGEVDPPTAETLRASVDQIKAWIDEACKKLKRPSDLERQVIGGLSKTVMKDGRTMWLSPAAAARWAEEVEPEAEPEVAAEPHTHVPGPEGDPQLEPEPGPTPQEKQPRPARRWLCLSGCSASVSTTQLHEI